MSFRKHKQREAGKKYLDTWLAARKTHEKGDDPAALQHLEAAIGFYEGEVDPSALDYLYRDAALLYKKAGQHDKALEYAVTAAELGSEQMRRELDTRGIAWRRDRFQMEKNLIGGLQNFHVVLTIVFLCLLTTGGGWLFNLTSATNVLIFLGIFGYGFAWFSKRIGAIRQAIAADNYYRIDTLLQHADEARNFHLCILVCACIAFYMTFGDVPWSLTAASAWCGLLLPNLFSGFRPVWFHLAALALAAVTLFTGNPYFLIASLTVAALRELYCIVLKHR